MVRERGFLLEKGGVTGEGRMKIGGGDGPESPHFIDGNFLSLFLSSPPVLVQEKLNARILLRAISRVFIIRTGLAIKYAFILSSK